MLSRRLKMLLRSLRISLIFLRFFLSLKLNLVANQLLETEFCFNCEELASPGAFSLQVFNCRLVDLDLALGYCTLLPQKEVFENLWKLTDKAWQNYDKILV